jgi:Tol biopolymer transport system component
VNRFLKIADGLQTDRTERIALAITAAVGVALSTGVIAALIYLLVALGPLMSPPIAHAQAVPPAAGVQLQAGIEKENVDGDLKAAMSIYEKIASDASATREVRAKALLRLAGCDEKLGKQAKQVYEQIVREYSDQPAAAQARSRLATIRQQEHPVAPETMSVRRIDREKLGNLGPGPDDTDGHRATYTGPDGNLYFGDISGHAKSLVYGSTDPEFRRRPAWEVSRDLTIVALMLPKTETRPVTLALVKADGTGYRELLRDEQGNILGGNNSFEVRWSWDARTLLVNPASCGPGLKDIPSRLWLVSVADGKPREVVHEESGMCIVRAAFSPDGQFVAYEVWPTYGFPPGATLKVFVVPIQGGEPRLAYESEPWSNYRFPFGALADWTADGRYLAIKRNHEGRHALFLLPMKAGAAVGSPVFVRDGDFEDAWSTLSGALIFMDPEDPAWHLASIDPVGKIGQWALIEPNRRPFPTFPSFSPDASQIAYPARDSDSGATDLIVKDLTTGKERVVYRSNPVGFTCQYSANRPIIFCNSGTGEKTDLLSVSVDSGGVEKIATFPDARYLLHRPQDDNIFYFVKNGFKGDADPKVRWDRITQKETAVADPTEVEDSVWTLSLDGRWILRQRNGHLSFRSSSGGDWKTLAEGLENSNLLGSTPDGNWALYVTTDAQGHPGIYEAPFSGGEPRRVGDLPNNSLSPYGNLAFSPDGKKILALGFGPLRYSLWTLENFEPKISK